MIIGLKCTAIDNPHEPNIHAFAEMTADGVIAMNGSKKSGVQKMLDKFSELIKNRDTELTQEDKDFVCTMIRGSWSNYVRHYPGDMQTRLENKFSVCIPDALTEANYLDDQMVYILTKASGNKIIIA